MNKKIKYGIIGAGYLGGYHTEQMSKISRAKVLGVYDIIGTKALKLSKNFNINCFDSLDDLLSSCDAVSICTPASNHYEVVRLALNNNCHIFIEKPITSTLVDAQNIIDANSKINKVIQVGHIERFNGAFTSYSANMKAPLFIESHRLSPYNIRGLDVPVVLDLMIHDIDLVLSLVKDEISSIHATGSCIVSDFIDLCNARIKFKNGCVANLTASRVSTKQMRKMRVFEKNIYSSLDFQKQECLSWKINSNAAICEIPVINKPVNALYEELKSFIESITLGVEPKINELDGYNALNVAIKIQELIEKNRK